MHVHLYFQLSGQAGVLALDLQHLSERHVGLAHFLAMLEEIATVLRSPALRVELSVPAPVEAAQASDFGFRIVGVPGFPILLRKFTPTMPTHTMPARTTCVGPALTAWRPPGRSRGPSAHCLAPQAARVGPALTAWRPALTAWRPQSARMGPALTAWRQQVLGTPPHGQGGFMEDETKRKQRFFALASGSVA